MSVTRRTETVLNEDPAVSHCAELVRQHLRKVLAKISAHKDQQRERDKARARQTGSLDSTVEVERDEDTDSGTSNIVRRC